MATIYYYVDESFRKDGEYWHCNIGGALLENGRVVDAEIAMEETIYKLAVSEGFPYAQGEFKYSDFFRDTSDEFKFKISAELTRVLAERGVRFLVSHAKIHNRHMKSLGPPFGTPSKAIQQLSYVNINNYLAAPAATHVVQMIVDLGISKSFRSIYDMYAGALRSIPMLKARGITDDQITISNYRNLPRPVFLTSGDSRLLQFSDFLIGLLLCREVGALTPFKLKLLEQVGAIMKNVEVVSVEWNKDAA